MKVSDLASIIQRAQQREQGAFEALVDEYSVRLHGFLRRLTGRREDAEDLVQEVFVRMVRTIEQYNHDGRFEGWLFRIATNLARDRVRQISRRPGIASLQSPKRGDADGQGVWGQLGDISEPAPDYPVELADDVDQLQKALTKLPAAEREVVMLRHYSDMSFAEIAEAMGTPLGTALARAHRGLSKLRTLMESTS